MIRLWVLRHAKSSWDTPGLPDHERPLSARGRAACAALRSHCATAPVLPEVVLCSTARRTRQTLEAIAPALGDPVILLEGGLYHAGPRTLLDRLRALDVESALLIGHNPGLHELVLALAAPGPMRDRVAEKLPTGALVTLDLEDWATLAPGCAAIESVTLPRELAAPGA